MTTEDLQTQEISIDINDNKTYEYLYTKQYDTGRIFIINITKDGLPFDIYDCTVIANIKKPDGTVKMDSCSIVSGNQVQLIVTDQLTAMSGKIPLDIQIVKNSAIIKTVTVYVKIEKSVINPDDVVSSDEFNALNDLLIKATTDYTYVMENTQASADAAKSSETNAKSYMNNAKSYMNSANTYKNNASTYATNSSNSATLSESWAVGGTSSRDGEDTNNSKYYATQSANSASASKTSETNAKTYASNASKSATTAQNYAIGKSDSAKYYYEQAKTISESLSGALKPMGTVTFANLRSLSDASDGDMYNISNQFTTTSVFKEGSGHVIPAGSNVYKTVDGYWDVLAGSPVTGLKGSKETKYRTGLVNLTPENLGLENATIEIISDTEPTSLEDGNYWVLEY